MSRIDYSKWDHIDTDSSDDEQPQPLVYDGEQDDDELPPLVQDDEQLPPLVQGDELPEGQQVQCVRILCNGEKYRGGRFLFETVSIQDNHAVFGAPVSPVSTRIGLPLHVYQENPLPNSFSHPERCLHYSNQPVTYLMIDPISGFAPLKYQSGVGTALIARHDKKPLTEAHLEAVWQFCDHLLESYSEGVVVPERDLTRAEFEAYFSDFKDGKAHTADKEAWQHVVSPYEV